MFARRCLSGFLLLCLGFSLVACSNPSIVSIEITPTTETFIGVGGQRAQFTAIGTFKQGDHIPTTQDVTNVVTWKSNAVGVASISSAGVATPGGGYGSTDITASMEGFTGIIVAHATVIVCQPDPTNPSKCAP
jgi:hypothetical protein